MTKEKKLIALIICLSVFLIGIGTMLYPIISSRHAEKVQSQIWTEYENVIETIDNSEIETALAAAQKYNQQLFDGEIDRLDPKNNGYFEQLNLTNNGIMAYISIPKIKVNLPVYYGSGDESLLTGAGHMPQSSLPVGGENTHCVISAHTGMATNPMFSDLELLKEGDVFEIFVLGETLYYQVYDINVVLPEDIEFVQAQEGKDLCTLVTCTPYGVNSHRLLVCGKRIAAPENTEETAPMLSEEPVPGSVWLSEYYHSVIIGLCIAVGIVVLFASVFLIRFILQKRKRVVHEK